MTASPAIANLNATDAGGLVQPETNTPFWAIGADGVRVTMTLDGYGKIARYVGRAFGGAGASPTAVGANKGIVSIGGAAYDGVSATVCGGTIQLVTDEAQTPTAKGAHWEIWATPTGSPDHQRIAYLGVGKFILDNLPTSDPGVVGQLWDDNTYLRRSAG